MLRQAVKVIFDHRFYPCHISQLHHQAILLTAIIILAQFLEIKSGELPEVRPKDLWLIQLVCSDIEN
jgi:hypothetical protein